MAVLTAVGQIRLYDVTLEQRYHRFVNSDDFQTWFWAMSLPITWTSEKIESGLEALRTGAEETEKRISSFSDDAEEAAR